MRKPRAVSAALASLLVLLAGCASIQDESQPVAVQNPPRGDVGSMIDGPKQGANQWDLVRGFVRANAQEADNYDAPRSFITGDRAKTWNPGERVTVVGDEVNTNPNPNEVQGDPAKQSVLVSAKEIGTLAPDGSFQAAQGDDPVYQQDITVAKNRDNQWRIDSVADGLVIRVSDFQRSYQQVSLDFMEPKLQAPIPDVRYLRRGTPADVATRIVNGLIHGPSTTLQGAVRNNFSTMRGDQRATVTAEDADSVTVNLPSVEDTSEAQRKGMIEQILRSLRGVVGGRVEVRSHGTPLDPGKRYYRFADLPSYSLFTPSPSAGPLYVRGGTLQQLSLSGDASAAGKDDRGKIDSTSGLNDCSAVSGSRSLDGNQLAMVCAGNDRQQHIRIGEFGKSLAEVPQLGAAAFTRPTWTAGSPQSQVGYEVWTVANGKSVLRLHRSGDQWQQSDVDASRLFAKFGSDANITDLRLSRDGIHAAAVIDGYLVVCTVQRDSDGQAQLTMPVTITNKLQNVTGVDWISQTQLIAISGRNSDSISTVSVDGLYVIAMGTTNMSAPVQQVAAAPGKPFLAVASGATFSSSQGTDSWIPISSGGSGAEPFYPG